ncbi:hypothetical protein ACFDR9_003749 [Janthinobacterium sp. CG_23.3]|uniref:hypothetical protein n=1 Tax=unclassified Janthinobacterium TaxID=2610881 RepID=UPI000344BBB6|nr:MULTISPECIES: hypothetical protein [unclassified Janthinobacterium]MEC5160500.1 hypothetical protein [Janthinobacterium sp. CG_S6]
MTDTATAQLYKTAVFTDQARADFPCDNLPDTPVRVQFLKRIRRSGQDAFENVYACWRDMHEAEFIGRFLGGTLTDFAT